MIIYNQHRVYRVFQLISFLKAKPPKNIRGIVKMLDTSERTVYRYMDLLRDLGFTIEKDRVGRFWIAETGASDFMPFTPQEREFLEKLVKTTGKRSKLCDSILQKLSYQGETHAAAEHLFKAHLAQIVEQISLAIAERRQLLIRHYSSANSQTVKDRLVEPMCFTDDYQSLSAFEPKSMQNKYFNIERMGSAEVLETKMKHESKHAFFKPDVFGYQGKILDKEVEMQLNLRACLIMKEEYPMTIPFIKQDHEDGSYTFKAKVQSFQSPCRFALGFPDDVKVVGSRQFIKCIIRARRNRSTGME